MKIENLRCEYFHDPLGIDMARPRLSWEIVSERRGARQTAFRVRAATSVEALARGEADLWDSGKLESDATAHVEYGGVPLRSRQRAWWTVQSWDEQETAVGSPAYWEMGLLTPSDWQGSQWIGSTLVGGERIGMPCPYLRREAHLEGAVRSARLYVTALGIHEFYINGQRVGREFFCPGWTDYNKRVQYDAYDVTALLRAGPNAFGAILGDGWYCGFIGLLNRREFYGDRPRLRAQVFVEFEDGRTQMIGTDADWKTATGPLLEADFLMGETYDARREQAGWNEPGAEETDWRAVKRFDDPGVPLVARRGPPVRLTQEIEPAPPGPMRPFEDKYRGYLFDLGQNMVGNVRLRLSGPRGLTVRLRYGERLDADGGLYTENLRAARATDYYTLKGEGEETYTPRFTFHGFQYVEVAAKADFAEPAITGLVLGSDTPPTGDFSCSDPLVNQLQRNIQWGQRGNFLEVPTDCPQRDERLGWTGDAQAFVGTAAFNMDVAAFFTKWQDDVADSQSVRGAIPAVIPNVMGEDGGPAWSDAAIICPWTIYQCYGDTRILREHYGEFARFVAFMEATSPERLRCEEKTPGMWLGHGDWLALDGSEGREGATPKGLIGTAFFAHCTDLLARIAAVLGEHADAASYRKLHGEIRAAFIAHYLTPDGHLVSRTQTSQVLALHFDLLPPEARPLAAAALVADIRARGMHLSTGFVGSPYLPHVLTREGYPAVAFALLHQTGWPSWLYAVTQGATTIWERWDGWTADKGFQTPSMNSFNHYAYGAVGDWLYGCVAGIGAGEPGYKRIVIRPLPGDLASARARFHSMHGPIRSEWRRDGGQFVLEVEIPPNTTAAVHFPFPDAGAITEGGHNVADVPGVGLVRTEDGASVFEIGAGRYVFAGPMATAAAKDV